MTAAATFSTFSTDWTRAERRRAWDWYRHVPKNTIANVRFRRELIQAGMEDPKIAEEIWIACKRDKLFWINTFCWIEEPRERGHATKVIPFLTWPVQDWVVSEWDPLLGKSDMLSVKPRAFGMTWLFSAFAIIHPFLFSDERLHIGIASRDEQAVDNRDDPDSLLPKLDLLLKYQPPFLHNPENVKRVTGKLINNETGSTIIGYSATGNLGRGGRKWLWFMDEFAAFHGSDFRALSSTQFTTDCRAIVSTIGDDPGCAFNVIAQDAKRPMSRLKPMWTDVPPYSAGRYRSRAGQLELVDLNHSHAPGYKFILDSRDRSPWYDHEEARSGSRSVMAREVDCDFNDGSGRAFSEDDLNKLADKTEPCRERGAIGFDPETFAAKFHSDDGGPLSLWCELPGMQPSLNDAYSLGVDISAGTGASNSVISVFSRTLRKQIAEYVTAYDDPAKLARIAAALGRWFHGDEDEAFLVFEANGPVGGTFRETIKQIGYTNLYKRQVVDEKVDRRSKKLGYYTPADGPGSLLASFLSECNLGKAHVSSPACITEFKQYIWSDGKVIHEGIAGNDSESEGKNTHGDRAVAAALGWLGCRASPRFVSQEQADAELVEGSDEWLAACERMADDAVEKEFSIEDEAEKGDAVFNF